MSGQNLKTRMESLIDALTEGLHERREHVAVALLAVLAGQNVFLLGPPGTAKSMLARRLKSAFAGSAVYFEYLMQRFSTPEEIFGPVSIEELKKDNYVRKTEGFLPKADFAFLDEIWKSSPAILNTLLTIINEKKFRNGTKILDVPLKGLIAASNETPPENQGLEALYDRFLVRLYVPPMKEVAYFEQLLNDGSAKSEVDCDKNVIQPAELDKWRRKINAVKLSEDTLNFIRDIRLRLKKFDSAQNKKTDDNVDAETEDTPGNDAAKRQETGIYVSDRRWQKAAFLLKAAAFFCDRNETNISDNLLLRHCLWTTGGDREKIAKIVENTAKKHGFAVVADKIKQIVEEQSSIEAGIKEIPDLPAHTHSSRRHAIERLNSDNDKLDARIKKAIAETKTRKSWLNNKIDTPFVPENVRSIAMHGVDKQIDNLHKLKKKSEQLKTSINDLSNANSVETVHD